MVLNLTACKIGQVYKQPSVDVPQQFNNTTFADTSSIADIEWKTFFTDTTLQGLINAGLQYNYDLQLAITNIQAAQQQLIQSKLLYLPQVSAQISAQTDYPSQNSLNGISTSSFLGSDHINDYIVGVNLTWEADIWGKIRRQKQAALAGYLQTYEAKKAVQTQLVANIAQGFFNLLMLDEQLEITRKNLVLSDSTVRITQLLRNAGEVTSLAVQQSIAQQQSTAILIPQLEQSIGLQEDALQILTGRLPGGIQRSEKLEEFSVPDSLATGLPVAIVSRRPDVRAAENAIIVANAQVGISQANMYPGLNITVGTGLESFKTSNWFNIPASLFGIVTGAVAAPIFNNRQLKTQYEIAKVQREQAVIQFRQSVLNAVGQVSDGLIQQQKLKQQQQIAAAQVDTLRGAVKNAQLLFKSNMATYIEVLTAQGSALQAQLNLAGIKRQQLGAMVNIYKALGGGWK
jgi:NodT family efflux transporter outer membrane factor (OMF) lipoprotein